MPDSEQILKYLSHNKSRFAKEYHLVKVGIFGSYARGDQGQDSDIDAIVEFEENTNNLSELKQKLKKEIQSQFNLPF